MRLYISADIEGVAGVVDRPQLGPEGFDYDWARGKMTDEVNAAIRGARAAGIKEIVVSDSHGNGQNIILDRLEKGVSLVRSWPRALAMMEGIEQGDYAGVFLLGYHAGVNNMRGGLAHTMSSRVITDITLNDMPASESLISAALAGHFSTPVIMVTGDDVFVEEVRGQLGEIPAVVTKWSCGTFSARCRPPLEVQEEIEKIAQQAVEGRNAFKAYNMKQPINVKMRIKSRHSAELLEYLPFVTRTESHAIRFEVPDMISFSKMLNFILNYQPNL